MTATVAIIPARGGSKGVPRKNIRQLGNKPLVSYAIESCSNSSEIDSTVLTTDSPEIGHIGRVFGVDRAIDRPADLAADDVPLAPVIKHAFKELDDVFERVVCVQPTVPLLTAESLNEGIRRSHENGTDSVVFVRDGTHLYWRGRGPEKQPIPESRKNRQQLEPIFEEIGVFVTDRSVVESGRRVGDSPELFEVDWTEGIDIDTYADWLLAESQLHRQSVVYRLTGNERTGLGHVYRGITLADHIFQHDICFATKEEDDLAVDLLEKSNYPYFTFENEQEFEQILRSDPPHVIVNDILDTSDEYVRFLKSLGARVINFEDLGNGSQEADAVINALYEYTTPPDNHYFGYQYFCIRSEFRYAEKKKEIPEVKHVMVSFGGVDENDLTSRSLRAIGALNYPITVDIVLGPGYKWHESLDDVVSASPDHLDVTVSQDVSWMSEHMSNADLLVTSNGRTIFEAASLNLPVISIAQNHREQKHPFAHLSNGVMDLGLAEYVSEDNIASAVRNYINDEELRERMRVDLSETDIENGVERIISILFPEGNHAHC